MYILNTQAGIRYKIHTSFPSQWHRICAIQTDPDLEFNYDTSHEFLTVLKLYIASSDGKLSNLGQPSCWRQLEKLDNFLNLHEYIRELVE